MDHGLEFGIISSYMITIVPSNEILLRIIEIERSRERCAGIRLPVSLSTRLRKNSRKKSSYASVKIEGNPLSESEASEVIDSSKRHFLKPEQEIRNYYAAMQLLEKNLKAKVPFSRELILDVQRQVVLGESSEKVCIAHSSRVEGTPLLRIPEKE